MDEKNILSFPIGEQNSYGHIFYQQNCGHLFHSSFAPLPVIRMSPRAQGFRQPFPFLSRGFSILPFQTLILFLTACPPLSLLLVPGSGLALVEKLNPLNTPVPKQTWADRGSMLVVPRVFNYHLFLLLQKFTGAINLVQWWRKTKAGDLWREEKGKWTLQ